MGLTTNYWRKVLERTKTDTLHALGLDSWQRALVRIAVPLVALVLVAGFVSPADLATKLLWMLGAVGAYAVISVPVYLWNLFSAPARLDNEAQKRVAELSGSISEEESRRVEANLGALTIDEKRWLHELFNGEHPNKMPDPIWRSLEEKRLVSQGLNKNGINERYRGIMAQWFRNNP